MSNVIDLDPAKRAERPKPDDPLIQAISAALTAAGRAQGVTLGALCVAKMNWSPDDALAGAAEDARALLDAIAVAQAIRLARTHAPPADDPWRT